MKNLLNSIAIMLVLIATSNAAIANNVPSNDKEKVVLVKNEDFTFSIDNLSDAKSFNGVTYNGITKMLKIDSRENIAFVEIKNLKGELEYFLPVGGAVLNIDILDFEKGNYTVNIKLQETGDRIISANLERNF